jgi:PTH1 family peptidyl-tRNA hydrolase
MRFDGVNPGEHPEYIIVGLGNPGQRYEKTRHNIGFDVVDYIDKACTGSRGIKRMLHSSLCDKCVLDGYIVYIVKPQVFMNNSGMSVKDVMNYYRMNPGQLIVVHDDTKVKLGEFKIKKGGSAAGHNGIKSIVQHLHTDNFIRVRVGVGEKPEEFDMSRYVLSRLTDSEYKSIEAQFRHIKTAISCIFNYGVDRAMTIYNENY